MDEYAYVRQQAEWASFRLAALDIMEQKLREMQTLAEFARDHPLDGVQIGRLNFRLGVLQSEINALDDKTRNLNFLTELN